MEQVWEHGIATELPNTEAGIQVLRTTFSHAVSTTKAYLNLLFSLTRPKCIWDPASGLSLEGLSIRVVLKSHPTKPHIHTSMIRRKEAMSKHSTDLEHYILLPGQGESELLA